MFYKVWPNDAHVRPSELVCEGGKIVSATRTFRWAAGKQVGPVLKDVVREGGTWQVSADGKHWTRPLRDDEALDRMARRTYRIRR